MSKFRSCTSIIFIVILCIYCVAIFNFKREKSLFPINNHIRIAHELANSDLAVRVLYCLEKHSAHTFKFGLPQPLFTL